MIRKVYKSALSLERKGLRMIKIRKLKDAQDFYNYLENNAQKSSKKLRFYRKYYYPSEIGFYYHTNKNKTVIYYETGVHGKGGDISTDKTFLICWNIKFLKTNWLFTFLFVSPLFFAVVLFDALLILYTQKIVYGASAIVFLPIVLLLHYKQAIKLLEFIDDIPKDNEKT